jgi:hypothetical protein
MKHSLPIKWMTGIFLVMLSLSSCKKALTEKPY